MDLLDLVTIFDRHLIGLVSVEELDAAMKSAAQEDINAVHALAHITAESMARRGFTFPPCMWVGCDKETP